MKFCLYLLCLCLSGCFKTAPKPNPQIEETIIENVYKIPTPEMVEENALVETKKFYDDLYDDKDVIAKIFFAFDSNDLSERDKAQLEEKVANILNAQKEKQALIVGHSDWRGAADYNDKLGQRRAESVTNFLQSLGVQKSQLETISMGSRYATPDLSKTDSVKDRRCDIVLR